MPVRVLSETGYYHVTTRTAGKIALFEDDADRKAYLNFLCKVRDDTSVRVLAWVLMTDHVHLVIDVGEQPSVISEFMHSLNIRYAKYFNAKTGRTGALFQGTYWSKPIINETQLMATVHYVHMNPEKACISSMRSYPWSSYQEYAGEPQVADTRVVLAQFGTFDKFDSYEGSPPDVVRRVGRRGTQDGDVLNLAMELAKVRSSAELRALPPKSRNEIIRKLSSLGASTRKIARAFGIGTTTVTRALHA